MELIYRKNSIKRSLLVFLQVYLNLIPLVISPIKISTQINLDDSPIFHGYVVIFFLQSYVRSEESLLKCEITYLIGGI